MSKLKNDPNPVFFNKADSMSQRRKRHYSTPLQLIHKMKLPEKSGKLKARNNSEDDIELHPEGIFSSITYPLDLKPTITNKSGLREHSSLPKFHNEDLKCDDPILRHTLKNN